MVCDYSQTCVVLINWKNSGLAYFAVLLLLCGDISLNPGPSDVFPCGVCSTEVLDDAAAVCCDSCDCWIHVSCDPSLSMEDYHHMLSNPSTDPWFCFCCQACVLSVPLAPLSVLEALWSSVCSAVTHYQPVILCGDFNLPHIDWFITSPSSHTPAATILCDFVSDCFLVQLVSANTRQDSTLDLVLTNVPDNFSSVVVCDNIPGTDHDAVKFNIEAEVCLKATPSRCLYNYKKINQNHFVSIFSRVPWHLIDYDADIELSWAMWKDLKPELMLKTKLLLFPTVFTLQLRNSGSGSIQ